SDPDPTRLDPLLPAGAGERDLRGPRRLVAAQDALHPMAPVEATAYPCPALDATWARRSACMGVRYQRTRPLAECWGQSHERCLPQVLLRPTRAAVAYGVALPSKSRRMNRRIRNRTSGGVGGGGREAYPLPDLLVLRGRSSGSVVIEPEIDDRRRVGDGAGGHEVDAGGGDRLGIAGIDAARRLGEDFSPGGFDAAH